MRNLRRTAKEPRGIPISDYTNHSVAKKPTEWSDLIEKPESDTPAPDEEKKETK